MTLATCLPSGVHSTDQWVVLAANQITSDQDWLQGRMAKNGLVVYDGSAVCVTQSARCIKRLDCAQKMEYLDAAGLEAGFITRYTTTGQQALPGTEFTWFLPDDRVYVGLRGIRYIIPVFSAGVLVCIHYCIIPALRGLAAELWR